MDRVIMHCDLNSFYASVEMLKNPSLRGTAMAVGGSPETRHGIVLAKSDLAKRAGVKTGMALWQAAKLCPNIQFVLPCYEDYKKYSRFVRDIYETYTNEVEPYGLDECFLDLTTLASSEKLALQIAHEIRLDVKKQLGLTISVGVSYNKVFAKLGSDMKKPDAVTYLPRREMASKIWPLPVGELLYCGKSSTEKLKHLSIFTIGDLAKAAPDIIRRTLGKNREFLQLYARGLDTSPVMVPVEDGLTKSVGHGTTCARDLVTEEEVWEVMLSLVQEVGHRLRKHHLMAKGVQISVRNTKLQFVQKQGLLERHTRVPMEIAIKGRELYQMLLKEMPNFVLPARAISIRAIDLVPEDTPVLMDLFVDSRKEEAKKKLYDTVDDLRGRYGKTIVKEAVLLGDSKLSYYSQFGPVLPKDGRK